MAKSPAKRSVTTRPSVSSRNVPRGIWELARLHTRESWLCWYPSIWGACMAAGVQDVVLEPIAFARFLFGIWASVTATHCAFCTFNDICDQSLDKHVQRCKVRPLPSGKITTPEALLAFVCWVPFTFAITWASLGPAVTASFIPVWVLSVIYPFMKRLMPFPQVVLGAIIGGAVFPGWVGVTGTLDHLDQALPLFFATAAWVVYFDVFYATQDLPDDKKAGVKSLAVWMGPNVKILLTGLGILQIAFFAITALRADLSLIFWVLGVGVWAVNVPWHVLSLNLKDRHSGGSVFKANIKLGLYMTGVSLLELVLLRVHHAPMNVY